MTTRIKKDLLVGGGYLTSVAPLGIFLGINWEKYAPTTTESVKLGAGLTLILVFAFIMTLNKMKVPKITIVFGVMFAISFLIQSIMQDFTWISGLAFAGTLGEDTIFKPLIENMEARLTLEINDKARADIEKQKEKTRTKEEKKTKRGLV